MESNQQVEIFIVGLDEQLPRSFWAVLVKRRAAFVCERCGSKHALVSHHKDSNKENNCLNNGECLCRTCHMKEHWSDEDHRINRLIAIAKGKEISDFDFNNAAKNNWSSLTHEERSEAVKKAWKARKTVVK